MSHSPTQQLEGRSHGTVEGKSSTDISDQNLRTTVLSLDLEMSPSIADFGRQRQPEIPVLLEQ